MSTRGARCQSALAGAAPPGVYDDQRHPGPSPRLDGCPEMDVRRHEVGAPGDQKVRVADRLGIRSPDPAQGCRPAGVGGRVADGARQQPGRPEGMEERHGEPAVDLPLVRAVAVAQDGEWPVLLDDSLPAPHQLVEGGLPGHGLEARLPLRTHPAEGCPQAFGGMDPARLPAHLRAEEAGRHRVLGVALQADETAVLDVSQDRAHVGAVVGAHGPDHLDGSCHLRLLFPGHSRRAPGSRGKLALVKSH